MSEQASIYLPQTFAERDLDRLHDLIDAYAFGMLVAPAAAPAEGPMIAHVPFVLDRGCGPRGTLLAHVARANPVLASIETGAPVVAVFRGPHGYVSPGWYASRDEVPTWNYVVVHAVGTPRVLDDRELLDVLARLAAIHESGQPDPWTLADLTPETMGELFPAIAGFAIEIASIEGKLKLSQNRRPEDREGAIRGLRERGGPDDVEMVALMTRQAGQARG